VARTVQLSVLNFDLDKKYLFKWYFVFCLVVVMLSDFLFLSVFSLNHRPSMDFTEVEFFAENEYIEVVTNFTTRKPIELFAGTVGPFEAGLKATVPVWAAIFLKQRHRCKLVSPSWMDIDRLEHVKAREVSFHSASYRSRLVWVWREVLHRSAQPAHDRNRPTDSSTCSWRRGRRRQGKDTDSRHPRR